MIVGEKCEKSNVKVEVGRTKEGGTVVRTLASCFNSLKIIRASVRLSRLRLGRL